MTCASASPTGSAGLEYHIAGADHSVTAGGAVALTVGSVPRIGLFLNYVNFINFSFSATNENDVI